MRAYEDKPIPKDVKSALEEKIADINARSGPEQLKAFNSEGYFFDADASEKGELVFKRHEQ